MSLEAVVNAILGVFDVLVMYGQGKLLKRPMRLTRQPIRANPDGSISILGQTLRDHSAANVGGGLVRIRGVDEDGHRQVWIAKPT